MNGWMNEWSHKLIHQQITELIGDATYDKLTNTRMNKWLLNKEINDEWQKLINQISK